MPNELIDDAVLFLVGVPRSGTSLLYKLLCLHPDSAYISNWMRVLPSLSFIAALNRIPPHFPNARRAAWFGADGANAYNYDHHRSPRERLFPTPIEGEPVYRRCGIDQVEPAGHPNPARIDRLRTTFQTTRRYGGGRLLVSKYLANNHYIPALVKLFPNARFVEIVRDGRAVAYSLSRVHWWQDSLIWWYGGTPGTWRAEGRDPWELCARYWVRELAVIDEGLTAVPASQRLEMRYEELVAEPIPTARRIAAFAGLPEDPDWTRELGRLSYPNKNESWRTRLAPSAREHVEAIQHGDLRRLGYLA